MNKLFFEMKQARQPTLFLIAVLCFVSAGLLSATTAGSQPLETTGEPGSPSATTTIDGKQLPPPPDKQFGGRIERSVLDSAPYWRPSVVTPEDIEKLKMAVHGNPASE